MTLKKPKNLKKTDSQKGEKPPKTFIIIFSLFVILASVNLLNDLGTFGAIKPFGFVDSAWAAVRKITGEPAPNRREITRRLITVGDVNGSLDRCEIIDPNLSKIVTAAAYKTLTNLKPLGENPGGLNQAIVLDSGAGGVGQQIGRAKELGFSYILGMVTQPNGVTGAIDFVNQSLAADLIPVVRLCYANVAGCDVYFKDQNNIVAFYTQIAEAASGPFVAMLGANEPGTGDDSSAGAQKEFLGFIDDTGSLEGNYDALVNETNSIAQSLQNLRGQGLVLLSPGAFNLTNAQSNDVTNMLYTGATLDLGLYDVLMGNTYEVGGRTAYSWYENSATGDPAFSLKSKVDSLGGEIQVIITEFGIIRDDPVPVPVQISNAKASFKKFCEDENVQGVMFFRAVEGLPETQSRHALSDGQIEDIIGDCMTPRSELPDYAWANCSLETYTYDDEYSKKSTASLCGIKEGEPDGFYLRALCSGDSCTVRRQDTVSIQMPIRQFGSISASGAPFFDYTPISVDLGTRFPGLISIDPVTGGQIENDAINQFAGKLTSGSKVYPMPWLGNAINTSSQLIKADTIFSTDLEALEVGINASIGSSLEEKRADIDFDIANPPANATDENKARLERIKEVGLTDELALCGNNNMCADTGDSLSLESLRRNYRPTDVLARYKAAPQCDSGLIYRTDTYNYVEGPEIKVGDVQEESYPAGDVCTNFVSRSTGTNATPRFIFEDSQGISCTFNANNGVQISGLESVPGVPLTCADLPSRDSAYIAGTGVQTSILELKRCANGTGSIFDNTVTGGGNCDISPSVGGCFDLKTQQATVINSEGEEEIAGEVYLATYPSEKPYRAVDEYEIPGIYDSLYWMYKRNVAYMGGMQKRLVAKTNLGWDVNVSSNVRDANREIDKGSDFSNGGEAELAYKYATQTNAGNIFKNEYYYAKGDPDKVDSHYYDWLGYVDILQELQSVYVTSAVLPSTSPISAEEFWEDSFADVDDLPEILREKQYLKDVPLRMALDDDGNVVTLLDDERIDPDAYFTDYDLALKGMRYPMHTCDSILEAQVVYLKRAGVNTGGLTVDAFYDLIEELKIPDPTCVSINDSENAGIWQQDGLAEFLCSKGYTELCYSELQCVPIDKDSSEEPDVIIGDLPDNAVTCPIANGYCTQGSSGTFTHGNLDAIDFVSDDINLYAPFTGKIVSIDTSTYCSSGVDGGDSIYYEGTINDETYTIFVTHLDPNSVAQLSVGQTFNVKEKIAKLLQPTVGFDVTCGKGQAPGGRHLHVEAVRNGGPYSFSGHYKGRTFPINSFTGALGCNISTPNQGCGEDSAGFDLGAIVDGSGPVLTPESTTKQQYICEVPNQPETDGIDTQNPSNDCNEFNCFIEGADQFEGSLSCAANTLSNSITGNRPEGVGTSLAEILDWYGPFCDAELRYDKDGNRLSVLPFGHNWAEIYDEIAPSIAQRSCTQKPPDENQSLAYDFYAECNRLPLRKDSNPEAWEFFRGALENCTLSDSQLTWEGSTDGESISDIANKLRSSSHSYQGATFDSLPEGKLEAVINKAKLKGINPYLLIAVWGTETAYGWYDDDLGYSTEDSRCNVYDGS